jgi:hypothetical protein
VKRKYEVTLLASEAYVVEAANEDEAVERARQQHEDENRDPQWDVEMIVEVDE